MPHLRLFYPEVRMKRITLVLLPLLLILGCKDDPAGPAQATSVSAKEKYNEVKTLAASYGNTMALTSATAGNVGQDGTAAIWYYDFIDVAASANSLYRFHAAPAGVTYDSTHSTVLGQMVITGNWIDSRVALDTAEHRTGNQFRATHGKTTVEAVLMKPSGLNSKTTWWISYTGVDDAAATVLEIDAITGSVLSTNTIQ